MIIAETDRLFIRSWHEADRLPFSEMNKDKNVMKYLGKPLTRAESDRAIDKQIDLMKSDEPAFWAVERKVGNQFIGCIGVKRIDFDAPFIVSNPSYEAGWRLGRDFWGHGFASEGAKASINAAFESWIMPRIYSFTVPANVNSQSVMHRIGMSRIAEGDFEHPNLSEDDPLSKHVLYEILRDT